MAFEWYAVRCRTGREKHVRQYLESELERNGMQAQVKRILIPFIKAPYRKGGKKLRTREASLMTGYLFVEAEMTPELIQLVRSIPACAGFVGTERGRKPTPIPELQIKQVLQKVEEAKEKGELLESEFEIGEAVRIIDGPFSSFEATIQEIDTEKGRLKVRVKIFGRETPVEVSFTQVERII